MGAHTTTRIPKTIDEALKMGFEYDGGLVDESSEDARRERGTANYRHPDGRNLSISYKCGYFYGTPKLDRLITKADKARLANPDFLANPDRYDERGFSLQVGA